MDVFPGTIRSGIRVEPRRPRSRADEELAALRATVIHELEETHAL